MTHVVAKRMFNVNMSCTQIFINLIHYKIDLQLWSCRIVTIDFFCSIRHLYIIWRPRVCILNKETNVGALEQRTNCYCFWLKLCIEKKVQFIRGRVIAKNWFNIVCCQNDNIVYQNCFVVFSITVCFVWVKHVLFVDHVPC